MENLQEIIRLRAQGIDAAIKLCLFCMKSQIFNDGNKQAAGKSFDNHFSLSDKRKAHVCVFNCAES